MTRELSPKAGAALLKKAFNAKNALLTHTEALDLVAQLKGYEAWSHLHQATQKAGKAGKEAKPAVKAATLNLAQVLQQHYGVDGSFSALPRDEWRYEVGQNGTDLSYWDWVVKELEARELYVDNAYTPPNACKVTLPDGTSACWNIESNLTDRWGSFNHHAWQKKPGLVVLELDEALDLYEQLTKRLREQMWGESTFVSRKDGRFGLLFEVEFASRESEAELCSDEPETLKGYAPHAEVVAQLLSGLKSLQDTFDVEMCVPDPSEIIWNRPAVWAFVPLDAMTHEQREALGQALSSL